VYDAINSVLPSICEGGAALAESDTDELFIKMFIGGVFNGRFPLSLGIGL
jgi:hypothetical protein